MAPIFRGSLYHGCVAPSGLEDFFTLHFRWLTHTGKGCGDPLGLNRRDGALSVAALRLRDGLWIAQSSGCHPRLFAGAASLLKTGDCCPVVASSAVHSAPSSSRVTSRAITVLLVLSATVLVLVLEWIVKQEPMFDHERLDVFPSIESSTSTAMLSTSTIPPPKPDEQPRP